MVRQAEVNIGTAGHVDHGKTTLVHAITGVWADTHSEELKRGITIRLGYADSDFYHCDSCNYYTTAQKCPKCGGETRFLRRVSFVDCPGHESLMTVTISGAALMDGAILVIAANERCPQPQTYEHLKALEIAGIDKIVVVQNKVDLVSKERALESYKEIKSFLEGTFAENAPIIPTSANYRINIDKIIQAIEEIIPTPKRDETKPAMMFTARSFDVNKPGTEIKDLKGGVVGGSLVQGVLKKGDEIEIKPGINEESTVTEVYNLSTMEGPIETARPGGLIGIETGLDPTFTKSNKLAGRILGTPRTLPPLLKEIEIEPHLIERMIDIEEIQPIVKGELLVITSGTSTSIGQVVDVSKERARIVLKQPLCANPGWKVALSRKMANRWRLIGYGKII